MPPFEKTLFFGRPYDESLYWKVIRDCQLEYDLELFEDGDRTMIGENGINLSGGQKQRVSVARAAYAQCDITILDDPLSALDPEVARKLFTDCVMHRLKSKCVLLVVSLFTFIQYLKFVHY